MHSFPFGPVASGSGCGPYAWSDDASTCLIAPAGLDRITGTQFSINAAAASDNKRIFAAGVLELDSHNYGAAAGITRTLSGPDTLYAAITTARTLRGDPIGFMKGVFGPSISIGGTLGMSVTDNDSGEGKEMISAGLGFQFSVFPTIAIGANVSNLRLFGDRLYKRIIGYGFSTVFDRRFRGHFSVTDGKSAIGFDLGVNDWLTVRTGTDGSSWNAGVSIEHDWLRLNWAVLLNGQDCRQVFGISVSPGGYR